MATSNTFHEPVAMGLPKVICEPANNPKGELDFLRWLIASALEAERECIRQEAA